MINIREKKIPKTLIIIISTCSLFAFILITVVTLYIIKIKQTNINYEKHKVKEPNKNKIDDSKDIIIE